jgi:predicted amidohydrolase
VAGPREIPEERGAAATIVKSEESEMPIKAWRSTCIQMKSSLATQVKTHEEAWNRINGNVRRAVELIEQACDGPMQPKLVVLPEFALQGPPHGEPVAAMDQEGLRHDPRPRHGAAAGSGHRRRNIYIAGNLFEIDPRNGRAASSIPAS